MILMSALCIIRTRTNSENGFLQFMAIVMQVRWTGEVLQWRIVLLVPGLVGIMSAARRFLTKVA
jgi:hypothetical protein